MVNKFFNILLLFSIGLLISTPVLSQDDFDVDEYLEEINFNKKYTKSKAHKKYLEEELKIIEFDREKWERLRLNIVNEFSGFEYEGEDGSSYTQRDNPYRQQRGSYRKYREKKNAERIKRLPKKKKKKRRQNNDIDMPNISPISPFWSSFILVIVIIGLAALIFFLFFNQIKDNKANKKVNLDIDSIIPTEIPKTELELLLEKALAKEDYREAIRIYFIFIIRGLITKGWIEWEKEKTNISYLREMNGNSYQSDFESTVSVYEIVWYGEREINKEEYNLLEPRFKTLVENLEK